MPETRTFVCYARQDEAFVMQVVGALLDRGVPVWIDQRDIPPGADWSKAIDAALNACTRFLIVLSPDAVHSDEVRGELRVALNDRKRVVPLLYRPCQVPRQLLLRQHIDFTRAELNDASIDRLVRALGDDGSDADAEIAVERDDSSRQTLLDDVHAEVKLRLDSIGTHALLPILVESQPHQLARPWDSEAAVSVTPRSGPTFSDILELFDDEVVDARLLILGRPGSGKTTALLRLMRALAARAVADAQQPVPVLLSLASWKDDKPIGEWIVDEMKAKYGVRADLGVRWRRTHRIAGLLDGLDELPPERLQRCVDAINEFDRADRPPCLVVSCRQAEYENLTVKLRLRGAASLQPLQDDVIRDYLTRAGRAELWRAIQSDPDLVDMARSPLLLSFMTGLADGPAAQRWQNAPSISDRRRRLFDGYLSALTSPDASRRTYSREQMLRWLRQLATMLKRQGQTEFLIEQMQPQWVHTRWHRWGYGAGVFLVSTVLAAVVLQLSLTLFGLVPIGDVGLALRAKVPAATAEESSLSQPLLWMIAAAVGGLIASRKTIVPVETLTWSWTAAWMGLRRWSQAAALTGLDYGLGLGVIASVIWQIIQLDVSSIRSWPTAGAACGTIVSAIAAVYLALVRPSSWLPFLRRPRISRQLMEALALASLYSLVVAATSGIGALLSGIAMFCILGLSWATTGRTRTIIFHGLIAGLVCGIAIAGISGWWIAGIVPLLEWLNVWVNGCVAVGTVVGMSIGLVSRARERRDSPAIHPWTRWRSFMAVAVLATALGATAALTIRFGSVAPVSRIALFVFWSQMSLVATLALMLLGGIGGAVFGCITAGVLGAMAGALGGATGADVERRLVPNQGIRQSAMNVVIFAALGAVIIGIPYGLFNVTVAAVAVQVLPSPSDWLRLGIGAGVSFGLLAGLLPGAACIQHFALRTVLWASGALPLRYAAFLDFATERRLLQRVGGRYRFIHVLLRDYLGTGDNNSVTAPLPDRRIV